MWQPMLRSGVLLIYHSPYFLWQILTESGVHPFCQSGYLTSPEILCFCHPSAGITDAQCEPNFYVGSGVWTQVLIIHIVSILPAESPPRPPYVIFMIKKNVELITLLRRAKMAFSRQNCCLGRGEECLRIRKWEGRVFLAQVSAGDFKDAVLFLSICQVLSTGPWDPAWGL